MNIYLLFVFSLFHALVYSMFQYRTERTWLLHLILDGLKDTTDYYMLKKFHVFQHLFTLYNCAIVDKSLQVSSACIISMLRETGERFYPGGSGTYLYFIEQCMCLNILLLHYPDNRDYCDNREKGISGRDHAALCGLLTMFCTTGFEVSGSSTLHANFALHPRAGRKPPFGLFQIFRELINLQGLLG